MFKKALVAFVTLTIGAQLVYSFNRHNRIIHTKNQKELLNAWRSMQKSSKNSKSPAPVN